MSLPKFDACSVPVCERVVRTRGFCASHYRRWQRGQRMDTPIRPKRTAAERFWMKVDRRGPDECWLWTGAVNERGYGKFGASSTKTVRAHRFAYELQVGPIPAGHEVDHVCHTRDSSCTAAEACPHRLCMNPAHLEAVTGTENRRRTAGRPHRKWGRAA